MKLPFDFGIKLVFRLVIPGFFLSLGFVPLLNAIVNLGGWTGNFEYGFLILVIFMGWLLTISDMPIYMLLEGRRFWPQYIKSPFRRREEKRLARLNQRINVPNEQASVEAYNDISNFPMNRQGEYEVALPSRLGNQIYAFERYSRATYGLDAIFYWPRIWFKLDKDIREELDSSQALVDSTVYSSFSLVLSGTLWLLYAVFKYVIVVALGQRFSLPSRLQYDLTLLDQLMPRKGVACFASAVFILAGFVVYRLSLYLHAQYGELFKSIIDLNVGAIDVSAIINELAMLSKKSPSVSLYKNIDRKDQFTIAARYLQYHLYRCPNPKCNTLMKPSEIETHVCAP